MSEWREIALGDVLTLQRGFDITKKMQQAAPFLLSRHRASGRSTIKPMFRGQAS
jgi:hypothetical protein